MVVSDLVLTGQNVAIFLLFVNGLAMMRGV